MAHYLLSHPLVVRYVMICFPCVPACCDPPLACITLHGKDCSTSCRCCACMYTDGVYMVAIEWLKVLVATVQLNSLLATLWKSGHCKVQQKPSPAGRIAALLSRGRRIVELGSGYGLAGLALARRGDAKQMVLTDGNPQVVESE